MSIHTRGKRRAQRQLEGEHRAEANKYSAGWLSSRWGIDGLRARRAYIVVTAIVVVVAFSAWFEQADRPSVAREIIVKSIEDVVMDGSFLEREDTSFSNVGLVSPAFENEVLSLGDLTEVRVDEASGIVGFVSPGIAKEVFTSVVAELESKGWASVTGGVNAGVTSGANTGASGSFVKASGVYRWVYIVCMQAGESTSVVVQCTAADERS